MKATQQVINVVGNLVDDDDEDANAGRYEQFICNETTIYTPFNLFESKQSFCLFSFGSFPDRGKIAGAGCSNGYTKNFCVAVVFFFFSFCVYIITKSRLYVNGFLNSIPVTHHI